MFAIKLFYWTYLTGDSDEKKSIHWSLPSFYRQWELDCIPSPENDESCLHLCLLVRSADNVMMIFWHSQPEFECTSLMKMIYYLIIIIHVEYQIISRKCSIQFIVFGLSMMQFFVLFSVEPHDAIMENFLEICINQDFHYICSYYNLFHVNYFGVSWIQLK